MPITCKWHSGFSNLQQKNSRINLILAFSTRIIGQSLHLLDKQWLCKSKRQTLFPSFTLYVAHKISNRIKNKSHSRQNKYYVHVLLNHMTLTFISLLLLYWMDFVWFKNSSTHMELCSFTWNIIFHMCVLRYALKYLRLYIVCLIILWHIFPHNFEHRLETNFREY